MRDLSRVWIHVDMDAFYAAVETLSDPSLQGKPMAVGGMSMISTANYEVQIPCIMNGIEIEFRIENYSPTFTFRIHIGNVIWPLCRQGDLGFVLRCLASLLVNYVRS